jgi:hypothetical protein
MDKITLKNNHIARDNQQVHYRLNEECEIELVDTHECNDDEDQFEDMADSHDVVGVETELRTLGQYVIKVN